MRLCNYTLSATRINNAKPKGKLYKLTDGGGLFIEALKWFAWLRG